MRMPQYYAIPSGLLTLAANQRAQFPIQIENYYDFIWLAGMFSTDIAGVMNGTDVTLGGFLINVLPAAGQEKMFANQVPITHAFGTPGVGWGLERNPFWGRFPAGGVVVLDITNLINAQQLLRLTFFGVRIDPNSAWPIPGMPAVALPA